MKHTSIHIHLLATGARKGLSGFWWMLKIIVPISLLTTLLDYSGWIRHIEFLLEPIMGVMHLPVIATFPLIAGILTGVYGGIAAMTVLPLNQAQMTLIAIFLLISHNLIQEARESSIKKSDLTKLHLSIGVNHSMIDDPALFLSLGLSPFWLWVPRILAAILFVQLFNMLHRIARALRLINPKITGSIE